MSIYNEDQRRYLKYLASLPREAKCDCGWSPRGECEGLCYGHPEKGGKPKTEKESRDERLRGGGG